MELPFHKPNNCLDDKEKINSDRIYQFEIFSTESDFPYLEELNHFYRYELNENERLLQSNMLKELKDYLVK